MPLLVPATARPSAWKAAAAVVLTLCGGAVPAPAQPRFPASEHIPLVTPLSGELAVGDRSGIGHPVIAYDAGSQLVMLEETEFGWQQTGTLPIGNTSSARRQIRFGRYQTVHGPGPLYLFFTSGSTLVSVARRNSTGDWAVEGALGPITGDLMGFSAPAALAGPAPHGLAWRVAISRNRYDSGSDPARMYLANAWDDTDLYDSGPLVSAFPLGPPETGDFDGNGYEDVAVPSGGNLLVDYATAAQGFGGWSTVPLSAAAAGAHSAAGRLDTGNARDDLVYASSTDVLTVLLSTGVGFSVQTLNGPRFGQPASPLLDMAIGDLNADGAAEIVTLYPDGGYVWMNDGNGGFAPPQPFPTPGGRSCAVDDVDHDGQPDIVVGSAGSIDIFRGQGDGTVGPPAGIPLQNQRNYGMTLVDMDWSGHDDVVVSGESESVALEVLLSDGTGGLSSHGSYGGAGSGAYFVSPIDAVTFLQSGVLSANGDPLAPAVAITGNGDGALSFYEPVAFAGPSPIGAIVSGDLDGDTEPDFAAAMGTSPAALHVIASSGSPTETAVPDDPAALVARRLDGDLVTDLIVAGAGGEITRLIGDGAGGFGDPQGFTTAHPFGTSPGRSHLLALAELGGDPHLLAATEDGYLIRSRVSDTGALAAPQEIPVGLGCTGVAAGNLNGDFDTDVAVSGFFDIGGAQPVAGVRIFYGDGSGGFGGTRILFTTEPVEAADVAITNLGFPGPDDLLVLFSSSITGAAPRPTQQGDGGSGFLGVLPGFQLPVIVAVPLEDRPDAGALALSATPNPTRSGTRVTFALPAQGEVEVSVLDLMGRRVASLLDGFREAGRHEAHWNGCDANGVRARPGLYFVRLVAAGRSGVARIAVTR